MYQYLRLGKFVYSRLPFALQPKNPWSISYAGDFFDGKPSNNDHQPQATVRPNASNDMDLDDDSFTPTFNLDGLVNNEFDDIDIPDVPLSPDVSNLHLDDTVLQNVSPNTVSPRFENSGTFCWLNSGNLIMSLPQ